MSKTRFFVSLFLIACVALSGTAQEKMGGVNVTRATQASEVISTLQLAQQLAEYGYQANSPKSLIVAAEMILDAPPAPLEPVSEEEGEVKATEDKAESDKVSLDPATLLQDAKAMASENQVVLDLAAQIETRIGETSRSSQGGPYILTRIVDARDEYIAVVDFWGGELAEVAVIGDGDTDLDLYIFDENGNLIEADDDDYGDDLYVSWVPRWSGEFKIVVENLGRVYNEFALMIN